jgi:serine/threonine-protein kinase HipA
MSSHGRPSSTSRRWAPPRTGTKLSVFLGERPVGTLQRRGPSRYRFAYSRELLAGPEGERTRLSASLPIREAAFTPSHSAPFFEGLLPEGAVRTAVAEKLRLSEEDGFGMLEALGADCAGAVVILPEGQRPDPDAKSGELQQLSEAELDDMLGNLSQDPLGIETEPEGVRLSLGGVQDKLVLVRLPSGEFAKPRGGAASTCLLKPEHDRYEGLAANEAFCMRVAAHARSDAAATELLTVGSTRCLYVERFDRVREEQGGVARLHQEDMCQALGVLPAAKYEANGGPSVAQIVALLRRSGSRRAAADVNAFVKAVLVNFLLGNSDAHGKNFALLYERAGVRLAPLYDVVSTAVYPTLTTRLAMSIGGEEDPKKVDLASWRRLGEESGLGGQLSKFLQRWSIEALAAAETSCREAVAEGWHEPVIDAIVDACRERAGRLLAER